MNKPTETTTEVIERTIATELKMLNAEKSSLMQGDSIMAALARCESIKARQERVEALAAVAMQ